MSQDSHKSQYPSPICNVIQALLHHNTVTNSNVDQICLFKCRIFLIGDTHTQVTVSPAQSSNSYSGCFVWNQLPHVSVEA